MQKIRSLGIILGGLAGAGALAATAAVGAAAATTPVVLAPRTLTAQAAAATAAGHQAGTASVPLTGRGTKTSAPNHVIGNGTPASCTSAAVVAAVALGGIITFNCGPKPVTIAMTATAKVVNTSHQIVLNGGGKVTLSGGGTIRILYMNTCDPNQKLITDDCWEQQWPQLIVQNMTFANGYSSTQQAGTSTYGGGGGAIYDQGGQLQVINSTFTGNRCYQYGPDLGGGAIRAYGMFMGTPVSISNDTFTNNSCSNGGALSGLYANFDVADSLMTGNAAIGWGANPAAPGTPGGGSGGAIYTDGDSYNLTVYGTTITGNGAREGGGGIFYVVNAGGGTLRIEYSTMKNNPSGQFQNFPGTFDSVNGQDTQPVVVGSSIS